MKKIWMILIICTTLLCFLSFAYAAVMTDAELDEAIKGFMEKLKKEVEEEGEEANDFKGLSVKREADKIIFDVDNEKFEFNYDFASENKFYVDIKYTKDMSFDEANEKAGEGILPMYGFLIFASNKGYKVMDSLAYFFTTILEEIDMSDTNLIDKDNINNGVEYAVSLFNSAKSMEKDLYKINMEKISETDNEVVLRTNYIINGSGDFSVIENAFEKLGEKPKDNKDIQNSNNNKELPKAGINNDLSNTLKTIATLLVVVLIILFTKIYLGNVRRKKSNN